MGLDIVELLLGTEEMFGIAIPDADAAQIRTARQLSDYLRERLGAAVGPDQVLQRVFYRLRREASRILKVPHRTIRPESRWDQLLPQDERQRLWTILARAVGSPPWPELGRPQWLLGVLTCTFFASWWAGNRATPDSPFALWFGFFFAVGVTTSGVALTSAMKRRIPRAWDTVGATARALAATAPAQFLREEETWSPLLIETTVLALVAKHLGVDAPALDADFYSDLGAG